MSLAALSAPRTSVFELLRSVTIAAAAEQLGLQVSRSRFGPCPACGIERDSQTRRLPVGFSGSRWRHHHSDCGAGGDVAELLALRLLDCSAQELTRDGAAALHAHAWRLGLVDQPPADDDQDLAPVRPLPRRPRRPAPAPAPPRPLPPAAEVAALWGASRSLLDVETGRRWLASRYGLPAERLAALAGVGLLDGLARWLPRAGERWPRWARQKRRAWSDAGFRLALPLYDERGALAALRGRHPEPPGKLKALSAAGCRVSGLALAGPLGRELLDAGPDAATLPGFDPAEPLAVELWILEGGTDLIAAALHFAIDPDSDRGPIPQRRGTPDHPRAIRACLGAFSGSWSEALTARLPRQLGGHPVKVVLACDPDPGGATIARGIDASLQAAGFEVTPWQGVDRPDLDVAEVLRPWFAHLATEGAG